MEEKKEEISEGSIFFKRYVIAVVMQIALMVLCSVMTVKSGNVIYVFGPIGGLLFHILPFVHFGRFFLAKGLKKYGSYGWAKAGVIIPAVFFLLFVLFNIVVGDGCQLNVFGHLYWILLAIQLFSICILCSSTKNYRSEQEYLKQQEYIKAKYAKGNSK